MTTNTAKNPYAIAKPATKPSLSSLKASFDILKDGFFDTIDRLGSDTSRWLVLSTLNEQLSDTIPENDDSFKAFVAANTKFFSQDKPSLKDALGALEGTISVFEKLGEKLDGLMEVEEKTEHRDEAKRKPADIHASSPTKKRSAEESVDGQRSPKRLSSNRKETSTQQDGEENKEEEEKHSVADPAAAAAVEEHLVAAVAAPVKKTVAAKDPEEDTGDAKGTAAPVTKDAAAVAENLRIAPSMITSNKAMHQIDA